MSNFCAPDLLKTACLTCSKATRPGATRMLVCQVDIPDEQSIAVDRSTLGLSRDPLAIAGEPTDVVFHSK
jgi:hypothetical protein